ncbi:MAG: phosphoribosyl-AMP cyclohydrolase [Pelagibacteraceae bacterium TMED65]|nr:phosphoribosyl-AMP cyclohydrolase [Rickettsiales bacterium]OUU51607.1 MAG: phosphoribosyl-AMP cyclohydrolase [Pelagibacteraceae bacterium TMED65]|tara:strand:+ start:434 stop:904 length:471 start_codon:yes stop_codon:yes gene_type:complete
MVKFSKRESVFQVEEGTILQPKFDENNLIPVITVDFINNHILMHGYMNPKAFTMSIETGEAHYWSRSRKCLWKKGETSGLTQKIKEIMVDDDQDCVIFKVELGGLSASCHVGYKSCFYRKLSKIKNKYSHKLEFKEKEKVFDPKDVYGDSPNPTKL